MTFLFVGIGGGLGAMCRYAVSSLPLRSAFPFLTLLINLLGAVIIGFLVGWTQSRPDTPGWVNPLLKTGFCGGFTTFSTFSLEALQLWQGGQWVLAVIYAVVSAGLCILGVLAGELLARRLV